MLTGWSSAKRFSIYASEELYNTTVTVFLSPSCGINSIDMSAVFDDLGGNSLKIAIEYGDTGDQLYVEIERWDVINGIAIIHVKVPQINISDTYLTLYWDATHADNTNYIGEIGSTAGESAQESTAAQVMRCAEANPVGTWTDSTSNSYDGTGAGGLSATITDTGAPGIDFDTSQTGWVDLGSSVAGELLGDYTIACRVKYTNVSRSTAVFSINQDDGDNVFLLYNRNESQQNIQAFSSSGSAIIDRDAGTVRDGNYHTMVFSYDRDLGLGTFYFDGDWQYDDAASGIRNGDTDQVSLGQEYDGGSKGDFWAGVYADVQVHTGVKSEAWADLYQRSLSDNLVMWDLLTIYKSVLEQPWNHNIAASLNALWSDVFILQSNLNIYWRSSRIIQSNLKQSWEDVQQLKSVIEQDWRLYGSIRQDLSQRWSVLQGKIISVLLQNWSVKNTTPLMSTLNQFWNIQQDGAITKDLFFSIQIGGVQIRSFTDCTAGLDNSKAFNEATIKISSRVEYQSIVKYQNVIITQLGNEFHYFVAGKDAGWSVDMGDSGSDYVEEFVIRCESKTAALHKPYTMTINRDWPSGGSAKAIIEEMAGFENITVDFSVNDFLIPADYLTAENNTPWEVIQKITGPMRLQEQTLPNGTLIIKKSFKDDPARWDTLPPFYMLSADGGFNRYTEQDNEDQEVYNMVTVQDSSEQTVQDNMIIEAEDISSTEKRIRVWEAPWVGTFNLKHSGGDSVTITKNGVETEQITDIAVEIVDGKGTVSKPCYGISSFSFQENNLTGLEYSEGGSITTTIVGNSLVNIVYTTKYQEFIVRNTSPEKVQIYINGREV